MFWNKLKSLLNKESESVFVEDDNLNHESESDNFIRLQDDQIDQISVLIITCLPNKALSRLYWQRFVAMEDEGFLERVETTQEEWMQLFYVTDIVGYSWSQFNKLNDEDEDDDDDDDDDDYKMLQAAALENYRLMANNDDRVKALLSPFLEVKKRGGHVQFPGDKLIPMLDKLLLLQREEDNALISERIAEYRTSIVPEVLRLIAINTNKYGKIDTLPAQDEVIEFWSSVQGFDEIKTYAPDEIIMETLIQVEKTYSQKNAFDSIPEGGADFELWCSQKLTAAGVKNHLSSGGADQGIDIFADIGNRRIGIQCKRYNSPVGNKAVQEALAGKSFYDLDAVCVISTGGYTKSAKELSKRSDVFLYSENELERINELCF